MLFRHFDNKILCEAEILSKKGFAVDIIGPDFDPRFNLGRLKLPSGVHARSITLRRRTLPIIDPELVLKQLVLALRSSSRICHCYGMNELVCALALRTLGRRVIYDMGDDVPSILGTMIGSKCGSMQIGHFIESTLRTFEVICCRRFDRIVGLTKRLTSGMSKFNGRIVTIGYYPDPCFNPSNVDPFLVRKYKGFKVIVFDGRLIPEKGTYIMLSVADIVRRVIPNFKLLLIGGFVSHSEEKSFNRAISDLGLQNHVESVGWVTYCEVPKYINLGKLGLSLLTDWCYSYVITEPYKVLEMMSCGLPVIATNGNIVSRELIQESGGGILVDQSDIKAIADCVIRLLFDEYEANQMGLKAREFMEKTRRWSDFEEKLLSVYASLFPNR